MLNRFARNIARQNDRNGIAGEIFGMRASAHCALWLTGGLALAALPAFAQGTDSAQLTPEVSTMLGNALIFDPTALTTAAPKKPLRVPGASHAKGFDITRSQKPDGSATVAVKQPLQTDWTNTVGADLGPANPGGIIDRPLAATHDGFGSGAAWASIGVPNVGSVDARVDPTNEQGKLGTTLKHSIPFGGRFAVTLQNTYSVTETLGQQPSSPGDLPLMALPPPSGAPAPQVFGNEKSVKFNILPTGTTLGAGISSTSSDPVSHNTFSAAQKLYGPLSVTTAVTDFGQTTSKKSITAGFKLHW
jgi:hypothetical protein